MSDDRESYADVPKSVTEYRSDGHPNGAAVWTFRDMLISLLRAIDTGEMRVPDVAVLAYRTVSPDDPSATRVNFRRLGRTHEECVGVVYQALADMTNDR